MDICTALVSVVNSMTNAVSETGGVQTCSALFRVTKGSSRQKKGRSFPWSHKCLSTTKACTHFSHISLVKLPACVNFVHLHFQTSPLDFCLIPGFDCTDLFELPKPCPGSLWAFHFIPKVLVVLEASQGQSDFMLDASRKVVKETGQYFYQPVRIVSTVQHRGSGPGVVKHPLLNVVVALSKRTYRERGTWHTPSVFCVSADDLLFSCGTCERVP